MENARKNTRGSWTRRLFVRDALLGWIGLVIGPAAYSLLRRIEYGSSPNCEISRELGKASDFAPGQRKEVIFGGKKVLVARLNSGDWAAVSAVCTHLGCSVRLERDGNEEVFACNCHNSKFSIDGTNLSGPAPLPLNRYEIEVRENKVILGVGELNNGEGLE